MIIFFHIPKSGGTSVEFGLANHFGSNYVKFPATVIDYFQIPPSEFYAHRVLAGHITHDAALPYMNSDAALITLLRNPADRLRSSYNYFSKLGDGSELARITNELSFLDWLNCRHPVVIVQIQNAMIRQFTPESYWNTDRPANMDLIMRAAVQFIEKFRIVGFLSDMRGFSSQLDRLIGKSIDLRVPLNVSKVDNTNAVSDNILNSWVRSNSKMDQDFFDYCLLRFGSYSSKFPY